MKKGKNNTLIYFLETDAYWDGKGDQLKLVECHCILKKRKADMKKSEK